MFGHLLMMHNYLCSVFLCIAVKLNWKNPSAIALHLRQMHPKFPKTVVYFRGRCAIDTISGIGWLLPSVKMPEKEGHECISKMKFKTLSHTFSYNKLKQHSTYIRVIITVAHWVQICNTSKCNILSRVDTTLVAFQGDSSLF